MLQLNDQSFNIPAHRDPQVHSEAKAWTLPQAGFLKLNFDGASKGNPRKAGAGGAIETTWRDNSSSLCKPALETQQIMQHFFLHWNRGWKL
jgi:hypothetical protein